MHPAQQLDNSAHWAQINPSRCPCDGRGYLLSDWDSWHRCHLHGKGVPHPEMDEFECDFDRKAHSTKIYRAAYLKFKDLAKVQSWQEFRSMCEAKLLTDSPLPSDWVNAAEEVATEIMHEQEEDTARSKGYSCALEYRMAEEAMWEQKEEGR